MPTRIRPLSYLGILVDSLLARPDLASNVKVLQLFHLPDSIKIGFTLLGLLQRACSLLGVDMGTGIYSMTRASPERAHSYLQHLAILLCPNINMLLLPGSFFTGFHGGRICVNSGRTLPLLKTAALVSDNARGYLHGVDKFLSACALNLETLHFANLVENAITAFDLRPMSWKPEMTLPNVRRLVVTDIGARGLSALIHACPQTLDLDYTHHGFYNAVNMSEGDSDMNPVHCSDIVQAIEPLQKSLRRLSLVTMSAGDPQQRLP